MAATGKSLVELQKEIQKIGGKFYTDRIDLKKSSIDEIQPILKDFQERKSIGDFNVHSVDLKDGVKLMLGESTKILIFSGSSVFTTIVKRSSACKTVPPSGMIY